MSSYFLLAFASVAFVMASLALVEHKINQKRVAIKSNKTDNSNESIEASNNSEYGQDDLKKSA